MLFLESGQDIPGRPSEYVSLCGNDLDKSEAYLKEMELRDFFDYYSWIAETIGPPSDDDGKARFYYLRNFLLLCVNKKRLPHFYSATVPFLFIDCLLISFRCP